MEIGSVTIFVDGGIRCLWSGCREQLIELLTKIQFSETDTLYLLGDVLDRGFEPIGTLRDLMDFQDKDDKWDFRSWLKGGSLPTMDSFLELPDEKRQEIVDYLENANLYETI